MKSLNTTFLPHSPARMIATGLLMTSLCFLTACNPTGNKDEHHEEPVGLVLLLNGQTLATQQGGAVTYGSGQSIPAPLNGETGQIQVRFISEDGDRFVPDDPDYSMDFAVENTAIATVHTHEGSDAWSIYFHGYRAGTTTVRFFLMHDGHPDFESLPFNVTVAAAP